MNMAAAVSAVANRVSKLEQESRKTSEKLDDVLSAVLFLRKADGCQRRSSSNLSAAATGSRRGAAVFSLGAELAPPASPMSHVSDPLWSTNNNHNKNKNNNGHDEVAPPLLSRPSRITRHRPPALKHMAM
eukprot:PhM_4_TR18629/c0_g1_i5/m.27159